MVVFFGIHDGAEVQQSEFTVFSKEMATYAQFEGTVTDLTGHWKSNSGDGPEFITITHVNQTHVKVVREGPIDDEFTGVLSREGAQTNGEFTIHGRSPDGTATVQHLGFSLPEVAQGGAVTDQTKIDFGNGLEWTYDRPPLSGPFTEMHGYWLEMKDGKPFVYTTIRQFHNETTGEYNGTIELEEKRHPMEPRS